MHNALYILHFVGVLTILSIFPNARCGSGCMSARSAHIGSVALETQIHLFHLDVLPSREGFRWGGF